MMSDGERKVLQVKTGSQVTGELGRRDREPGSYFKYANGLNDDSAVSLTMGVTPDPYIWEDGLHPIFDMNLPEGELRAELTRRFSKAVPGFDDFDLLHIVGPHQLGRVSVSGHSEGDAPTVNLRELATYQGAEDLAAHLVSEYAQYSGVSGVQPKVLVRDEAVPDRVTHRGATHIVKAWNKNQYPELAANEFFCMTAAKAAGLPVPGFTLSDNGQLLIIERFDLDGDEYLGFEDFCVLSGWASRQKYDGTYEGCAKIIKAFVSEEHIASALKQHFMCIALSCGVRNGDHHLKNLGVLYRNPGENEQVDLAPVYDIVSTAPYIKNDTLALLLNGSKRWPKAEQLAGFGRQHCGLSSSSVRECMEQVADAISDTRLSLAEYSSESPGFSQTVAEPILDSWELGLSTSLIHE